MISIEPMEDGSKILCMDQGQQQIFRYGRSVPVIIITQYIPKPIPGILYYSFMLPGLKKILATILFILFIHSGYSQPDRFILKTALTNLRLLKIDTVVQFTPFQSLQVPVDKGKFHIIYSSYLFWKKDGNSYLTKISSCIDSLSENSFDTIFKTIRFPEEAIYDNIIENLDLLRTEHLKPGVVQFHNGSKDTTVVIRSSHPGYTGISLYLGTSEIENGYSSNQIYDGTILNGDGTFRRKEESVNYKYNTSTFIYRITSRLSKLLEALESTNSFD